MMPPDLQALDAATHLGRRQVNQLAHLLVGGMSVLLQCGQQADIEFVQQSNRQFFLDSCMNYACLGVFLLKLANTVRTVLTTINVFKTSQPGDTMADLFDNPMGLMGFEFVEFASPAPGVLEPVFEQMGFVHVARHRSKDVDLYRQGDINFIINREPKSHAAYFAAEHGPCACSMAFRVRDSHKAYARALEQGEQPVDIPPGPMELRLPAIKGIGGAPLYLIDRFEDGKSIYDIDFDFFPGVDRHPVGHGLKIIDHLTHNVYRGRMAFWGSFYERIFNFREIRYFDIKGEYTGLTSRAMTAPDGMIRIPLNEEAAGKSGQIEEYLMQFNGEGIQHIALLSDDLIATLDSLKKAGVPLMTAPSATYYEMLEGRLPNHGEDVQALQSRGILLDGVSKEGERRLLLQIFSANRAGPGVL
jgi:4-hydroxyphenylpyruvate dioxygenase